MRKNAGAWAVKFILFAIIVVFTFWGVGNWQADRINRVATVNGEPIPVEAYRIAYGNMLERLRQQFGNNLSDDLLKMLKVEEQALNQLIDQKLLVSEALRLGLRVSDEELAGVIRSVPAFQAGGVFDPGRYQRVLEANRLNPEAFEREQKNTMLLNKLRVLTTGGITVSDLEARVWYDWQNREVSILVAAFQPDTFKDIKATDDEITAFYEAHKEDYRTQPMVKAAYLRFGFEDYRAQIKISDEDVGEYYRAHLTEFESPKTVKARHILLKLDADAAEEDVESVRQRAVAIELKAKTGEDFATLARQYSEGPTKANGGDLGSFKKEDMVAPFADAAFAMNPGQVSEPVRTRFGWHIIKVEAVNPAVTVSEKDASDRIRSILTRERAKQAADTQAQKAYDVSYEGDGLQAVASALGFTIETTPPFDRQGAGSNVTNPQAFAAAAMALEVGEISDVVETDTADYLIQPVEKIPAQDRPLASVKQQVENDLLAKMRKDKAKAAADGFLTAVRSGTAWDAAAADSGVGVKETGYFKRNAAIPDVGYDKPMVDAAFVLSDKSPLHDGVLEVSGVYYVIRFNAEQLPGDASFEKEKKTVASGLVQQRQSAAFQELLRQLKDAAEITISEGFKKTA
ncbi:MAG: SurA N-terminal domain-containing protein [Pseudomonadota bacterium]